MGREGACEQVELTSGTCPVKTTDVLLSDRSAKDLGVTTGRLVEFPELILERTAPSAVGPVQYTVSGIYRAETVRTTSRFWFDSDAFNYTPLLDLGRETLRPASMPCW